LCAAALAAVATAAPAQALPDNAAPPAALQMAQAEEAPRRELEPRYKPVPPPPQSGYSTDYFFAATRGVADSAMAPAAKGLLFCLTIPVDLVLLPFAAIGGFFV